MALSTTIDRKRAYRLVKEPISRMPRDLRDGTIAEIAEELEVAPPTDRMLSWAEVKTMQAQGIEFGAHTRSHPMLARIPEAEALDEIRGSRADLRRELGIEAPPFCFPAGSMDASLHRHVKDMGFRGCFTVMQKPRVNQVGRASRFSLKRVGLLNGPAILLEAELDGPFHPIRRITRSWTHSDRPDGD